MINHFSVRSGWRSFFILLLIVIFTSLTSVCLGVANDIKGYIIDSKSGEVLPYANVTIKGFPFGTSTDSEGYFILVNPPENADTLEVFYIGYQSKEIVLTEKDLSKPLLVKLNPAILQTEAITVTAEDYQIWQASDEVGKVTFSPINIARLPSMGEVDIFRSLQLLPGISGASDGSAGLYIRGGTPDQNLVMLDGMTVYHVDHFFGMFSAFNSDAIKDVQVYKGGFPAKYGGRLSSVVELTGKNGNLNKVSFGAGLNLLSINGLLEVPLFAGKGAWIVSARRSYTDIIQSGTYNNLFDFITDEEATRTFGGGGGGRFGGGFQQEEIRPEFYFYDINSKLSYSPSRRDHLSLSIYNGKDRMDDSEEFGGMQFRRLDSVATEAAGTRARNEITSWGNIGASLKWSRRWHDKFSSNLLFAGSSYYSDHTTDLNFTFNNDSTSVFRGARNFAQMEDNEIRDLTLRFDNEWHPLASHRVGFGMMMSNTNTDYIASFNDTLNILDHHKESSQYALYLQDKWQVADPFEVTLGLRATQYSQTSDIYMEPRVTARYNLFKQLTLKGSWGSYYQFIHRIVNEDVLEGSRDFWLVADENLEPESASNYSLGISYETPGYLFEVETYHKEMENLLEFSRRFRRGADFGGAFFVGEGISRGVEFLAQKKHGALNGWIAYTLGEVEYTFPNLNSGESFLASHNRTHEVKFVGTYAWKRWSFSTTWVFGSGQPYTAPVGQYELDLLGDNSLSYIHVGEKNDQQLPDYHRMDVSVSYRFFDPNASRWKTEAGLSIFNLYDHKNVWYRKYDLDVSPIIISDVTMLGFTPTLFIKFKF